MSSLPLCLLMQPPLSQRTQQDEVLRHSRRGWISVHDCHHGKVGINALAWLEQLPHGEVWLHAFRAVIQESSGLRPLRASGREFGSALARQIAAYAEGLFAPWPAGHIPCFGRNGCCHAVHFKLQSLCQRDVRSTHTNKKQLR